MCIRDSAGGGSMMWIMLIAMFVIMYFFMIRHQNKKQKEIANFRKSLQVNQKVITAGGIDVSKRQVCHHHFPHSLYDSFGRPRFQSCGYAFAGKMEKVLYPLCFRFADDEP